VRVRTTAATAALLLAALTACGGGKDDSGTATAKSKKSGATATAPSEQPSGQVEKDLKFGTPAQTTGAGGTGVLQITPTNVVFTKTGGGETSQYGVFAVVTMNDKAMTAVAADEVPSWQWIAPDGQTVDEGTGNAFNVAMDKFNNAGDIQPGAYQLRSKVFDLTAAQTKGGTLIYKDGTDVVQRWKVPAADSGPSVAEVKKQLAS
jgi:hypothetical protein